MSSQAEKFWRLTWAYPHTDRAWWSLMGHELQPCPRCDCRADLATMLAERGMQGEGVEVGVWLGHYAACLLDRSRLRRLYCVDAWARLGDYKDIRNEKFDPEDYHRCAANLERFGGRAFMIRGLSLDVCKDFRDGSLDFIYIDANHAYEHVLDDIRAWAPKVMKGGILAGHDLLSATHPGVTRAVVEWLRETGRKAFVVPGDVHDGRVINAASWYVEIGGGA